MAKTTDSKSVRYDVKALNGIPMTQVVQKFETVKRQGSIYRSLCPWHEDTRPSLAIYERTNENHCHCFACGKGGSPLDYVMAHENLDFPQACEWLSREFGIPTLSGQTFKPVRFMPKATPVKVPREHCYIPMEYLKACISMENSFSKCLTILYGPHLAEHLTEEYMLGVEEDSRHNDHTLFPSIDIQGRVNYIKRQCYETDIHNPRFFHYQEGSLLMLGPRLMKEGVIPDSNRLNYNCLFGAHLLARYPGAKVILTESPKNALIMAAEHPEYVSVATGAQRYLKREALECLKGRDVYVFPDRDAITDWTEKLKGMADIANFVVSDICERIAPPDQPKYDVADYYISLRKDGILKT